MHPAPLEPQTGGVGSACTKEKELVAISLQAQANGKYAHMHGISPLAISRGSGAMPLCGASPMCTQSLLARINRQLLFFVGWVGLSRISVISSLMLA
jgi:hypothetical protein